MKVVDAVVANGRGGDSGRKHINGICSFTRSRSVPVTLGSPGPRRLSRPPETRPPLGLPPCQRRRPPATPNLCFPLPFLLVSATPTVRSP